VALVLLPACVAQAPAQTYTIKLKTNPDAGMTVTIRDTEKGTGSTKLFGPDGKLLQEIKPTSHELVYTLTILDRKKGDTRASRYKRVYEKARETEDGKSRNTSYHGRTVLFEQKDGVYRVGVAGKPPLDKKDLDKFIKRANEKTDADIVQDRAITPARAVAVGDRWPVDTKALGSVMEGAELDLKASRGEAKLVKVYTKGKSQFGVIEVNVKLAVTGIARTVEFKPAATLEMKMTIDTAIDGSSAARTENDTGKFKGKGILRQGDQKITVEMDEEMSGRKDRSEEKDDARAREMPAVELFGPAKKDTKD
jgi:hypothetical protein